MPRLTLTALTMALCATAATGADVATQGYYRQPALRGDQIFLVAEGDLWRASTQGGDAQRLTTHPGQESQPAVSPDGQWLAFTAQYDGGTEIYVMPVAGGVPRRLTWEGGGLKVWGITAAGEVLYTGLDGGPGSQLFAIDMKTGQRRQLPVGQASDAAGVFTPLALSATSSRRSAASALRLKNESSMRSRRGGRRIGTTFKR